MKAAMEQLKELLAQSPSEEAWEAICDFLDGIKDDDALANAVQACEVGLREWPDGLRVGRLNSPRSAFISRILPILRFEDFVSENLPHLGIGGPFSIEAIVLNKHLDCLAIGAVCPFGILFLLLGLDNSHLISFEFIENKCSATLLQSIAFLEIRTEGTGLIFSIINDNAPEKLTQLIQGNMSSSMVEQELPRLSSNGKRRNLHDSRFVLNRPENELIELALDGLQILVRDLDTLAIKCQVNLSEEAISISNFSMDEFAITYSSEKVCIHSKRNANRFKEIGGLAKSDYPIRKIALSNALNQIITISPFDEEYNDSNYDDGKWGSICIFDAQPIRIRKQWKLPYAAQTLSTGRQVKIINQDSIFALIATYIENSSAQDLSSEPRAVIAKYRIGTFPIVAARLTINSFHGSNLCLNSVDNSNTILWAIGDQLFEWVDWQ